MCCNDTETFDLPAEVIEMVAHYRRLLEEREWDWGDEQMELIRWARFGLLGDVFAAFAKTGDWAAAVREVVGDDPPSGVVLVRLGAERTVHVETGPARIAVPGGNVAIDVVVDSELDSHEVVVIAGHQVGVSPLGTAVETIDLVGAAPSFRVSFDGRAVEVEGAVRTTPAATLTLASPACARWSITDGEGGAWFPEGVLRKWDARHLPFFHGHNIDVVVPAEPLHVVCTRGLEFDRLEIDVTPAPGATTTVELDPSRLFDPAAEGWYGGDLHIHMNYSGDLVCSPSDAARMQLGEGLHLANLVVGNGQTSMVYDREALEQLAGVDLPWSGGTTVAQMGVEYRNDMLGHIHGLGLSAAPSHYYAGHERSDHPEDWPPNKAACEELRGLGATVGYAHPSFSEFPDDWSTDAFFQNPRSVEARELVAEAALGLVDSVDLISPFNNDGAVFLYHRLLSCGIRLAATAGTDAFLSFSHGPAAASNPPGWARVYARLGDQPLSVAGFKEAIRAGRTVVTNGPWLTFTVNGHGPGGVIDGRTGDTLHLVARLHGPGAEVLSIVGPDGVVGRQEGATTLALEVPVAGATWLAAVARGPSHPRTLDESVLAHTSPVYVDVAGRRVGRVADARWCVEFLDTLQLFVERNGRFHTHNRESHLDHFAALFDEARSYYWRVAENAQR